MADYIVLEQSEKNNRLRVVVHSEVPNGNNSGGQSWKAALVGALESTESRVPSSLLPNGRQAALDAGDFYEWEFTVEDDANATIQTRRSNLEAEVQRREVAELERMANRLRYFGHAGSI